MTARPRLVAPVNPLARLEANAAWWIGRAQVREDCARAAESLGRDHDALRHWAAANEHRKRAKAIMEGQS